MIFFTGKTTGSRIHTHTHTQEASHINGGEAGGAQGARDRPAPSVFPPKLTYALLRGFDHGGAGDERQRADEDLAEHDGDGRKKNDNAED